MKKEDIYREVCLQLLVLFDTECGWKFFREETFNDSHSGQNAKKMQAYLTGLFQEHPWLGSEFKEAVKQ